MNKLIRQIFVCIGIYLMIAIPVYASNLFSIDGKINTNEISGEKFSLSGFGRITPYEYNLPMIESLSNDIFYVAGAIALAISATIVVGGFSPSIAAIGLLSLVAIPLLSLIHI